MKKVIIPLLTVILAFCMISCSSSSQTVNETSESTTNISEQIALEDSIKSELKSTIPDNLMVCLWDQNSFLVSIRGDELRVMITTFGSHFIPLFAEKVCPKIIEIIDNNDQIQNVSIIIKSNNGGKTGAIWDSDNGKTGTFMYNDYDIYKNYYSVDDMKNYFKDDISKWEELQNNTTNP